MKLRSDLWPSVVAPVLAVPFLVLATLLFAPGAFAAPNLLRNGDAEAGPGSVGGGELEPIPFWTNVNDGSFTVVQYNDDNGGPTLLSPGPAARGANYFSGGPDNADSSITQTIDLSFDAAAISAGHVAFTLSGWLGGFSGQNDHALLSATWFDADLATAGSTVMLDSVFAADRADVTGLVFHTLSGAVPSAARSVLITLEMIRTDGSYNDGYADNLSFSLNDRAAIPTVTPVPEPSTYALMLAGLAGIGGVVKRRSGAATRA